ncbi:hypothetical protein BJV77DRAFT_259050 [Russula vinacea]|nr:hypothetical protein BJV77DRAFT_259050 [Russula vinacea]
MIQSRVLVCWCTPPICISISPYACLFAAQVMGLDLHHRIHPLHVAYVPRFHRVFLVPVLPRTKRWTDMPLLEPQPWNRQFRVEENTPYPRLPHNPECTAFLAVRVVPSGPGNYPIQGRLCGCSENTQICDVLGLDPEFVNR